MRISRSIPREMMPRDGSPGPTRRIESRHPLRVIRLFPSMVMGCLLPCESLGEMHHITCAEADGSVVSFRAQPDELLWNDGDVVRRHTPDLSLEYDDGRREIHEVKYLSGLSPAERTLLDRRTAELVRLLSERDTVYRVIDSSSSDFAERYACANQVFAQRRVCPPDGLNVLVREAVRLRGATTLGDIESLIPAVLRRDLIALALRRHLVIDINSGPLSEKTSVRLPYTNPKETLR